MRSLSDKQKKIVYWISCIVFAFFFLGILGTDGPILQKDSMSFIEGWPYIKQSYWLYVTFLDVCEGVFGYDAGLYVAYIIQSLFAFGASIILTEYLRRYFKLGYPVAFLMYIFTYLPYGYSLPQDVANHHIMTEAVAYPLFTIYMTFILYTFIENKKIYMVIAAILTILLVMTRSQLILLVPVYCLLWVIILLQNIYRKIGTRYQKWFWGSIAIGTAVCGCAGLLLVGRVVSLSGSGQFADAVIGRILCAIDEEDRTLFEGETQEIFDVLYDEVERTKYRYPYFRDGIWKWEDILIATNENTKMCRYNILEYYEQIDYETRLEYAADQIAIISSTLFYRHLDDYITMSLHLFLQSFVVAIFIHPTAIFTLCYIIAILLYLASIVVLWYANSKLKVDIKYSIPLLLTLLMIAAIVIVTNLIFFGQQRYVVYAFGCFYISCLILMIGIIRKRREKDVI